ncbi:hypothetical protein OGAPHI_004744 [Ogataea philodendri]|uniref:Spc7 kinetochore protein domain-containing protein n=1 Tax=Ogataea philodendri TaxID=1378263 RepID=A0A9P8P2R7_9ASCO|nr:uncharacterized protein OGAPHI_004744 [Ogataea philodendri]KAH3664030.1 hypothetical protein OGAPHI_004744 [Ogataea philodendri]
MSEQPADKENVAPRQFPYKVRKPNRRHTLLPVAPRSILKTSLDENQTIAIIPKNKTKKRRVSFATDVDVRSIIHRTYEKDGYAEPSGFRPRRRDSLQLQPRRFSLVGHSQSPQIVDDEADDFSQVVQKVSASSVEEDNLSQPMEMSVELNQEVRQMVRENYGYETLEQPDVPDLAATFSQIDEEDTMEFTQPVPKQTVEPEEEIENSQPMEFTQPIRAADPVDESMELTQPVKRDEEADTGMEFTQPIRQEVRAPVKAFSVPEPDSQEQMEFTQPIREFVKPFSPTVEATPPRQTKTANSTPGSSARSQKIRTDEYGSPQSASKNSVLEFTGLSKPKDIVESLKQLEEEEEEHKEANTSVDTSAVDESIIIAEKVPLAEVTMDSENDDDEANYDDEDDDYVHVTLPQFLNQVQVQFYDHIGPSERELTVTSEGSGSQGLHKYVDAVTEFPNFDYFYHLIAQRKSGIDRSQKTIKDFTEGVVNNNPTSVREFYESNDEVQKDLKVNYQALASLARSIAEHGNLVFMTSSLEGLLKSYENRKMSVNSQFADMEDIREAFSEEHQKCVKRRAELSKTLALLQDKQKNLANVDTNRLEELKVQLEAAQARNAALKERKEVLDREISEEGANLKVVSSTLLETTEEDRKLKEELAAIRLPSETELERLHQQFSSIQQSVGLKLVNLTDTRLELQLGNEFEIGIDLSTGNRTVALRSSNSEFSGLHKKYVSTLEAMTGSSLREYLSLVTESYRQFSVLVKELKIVSLYYQFRQFEDRFAFTVAKADKYSLEVNFAVDQVLSFTSPVKIHTQLVRLCNEDVTESAILNGVTNCANLGLFQRMVI